MNYKTTAVGINKMKAFTLEGIYKTNCTFSNLLYN